MVGIWPRLSGRPERSKPGKSGPPATLDVQVTHKSSLGTGRTLLKASAYLAPQARPR